MNLKSKMKAIADTPKNTLAELKHTADTLTAQHEAVKKQADKYAHAYANRYGFKPSPIPEKHAKYIEYKNHYTQHSLQTDHPKVHKQLTHLEKAAPQARLAYKRAARA